MESLLGTAEDKETSEQESRKSSEQEVSPFLPCPLTAPFIFISFYCLVCLLTVHHTLNTLLFLRGLCCQTWTPFQLTPPSSFCFFLSPAVALSVFLPSEDLQCWSSICTWEGDWQWREQGELWRENSRREEQNRVPLHKDRAICQPKGVGFETNRAVIRSKLAQKWVLCDWCAFFPPQTFNWVIFFVSYPQWSHAKKQGSCQRRETPILLWQNLKTRKTSQVYESLD